MSDKPEYGNAQKMREALEGLINAIDTSDLRDCARTGEWCGNCSYHPLCEAIESAKAALAAPPRNCDVGTAEEQLERFMAFCKNYPRCLKCPCCGIVINGRCEFVWGQMLYTKPEDASTEQEEKR